MEQKTLELIKKFEELKAQYKETKEELNQHLMQLGVGKMFQDPSTKLVYKIVIPTGTFVSFCSIGYNRTKKEDEKQGTLSKKEALSAGFEL